VAKGHILVALNGHQGVIFSLDYSSKENLLFSTSDDRSVNVWKLDLEKNENNRVKNAHLLTRFYGHDARVWKCCNFIDEKTKIQYLCSIGEDLNCCLWNVNEKELVYRFNPMRKGSKNIWSLCLNQSTMELITGWGDGGLRKFSLKSYLKREELEIDDFKCKEDLTDWSLKTEIESDFIRSILFLSEKIICSTNLGYLYLIDSNSNSLNSDLQRQRLLLKNDLLAKYNLMVKLKVDENNWVIALGTIKGFLFLINLKNSSQFSDNISVECIDLLKTERELMPTLNFSGNSSKICSLMWSSFKEDTKHRYFLLGMFFTLKLFRQIPSYQNIIELNRLRIHDGSYKYQPQNTKKFASEGVLRVQETFEFWRDFFYC
jgi:WD40 repeat protein